MNRGDVIGGYRIITEPTNAGGGKCMWAFAEKDGRVYFIKRFLEPRRPKADSTANSASKRLRLEECKEFEDRHRSIMKRLKHDDSGAGNLVLAVDFFCEGSTYYNVTERIETSSLDKPQALDPRKKSVLLKTLGLSLRLLHNIDVVHGDLKPGNVLVQKKAANAFYTAKLIDFDDAYISGHPPDRNAIGGDSLFGAPEWLRYLQGDEHIPPESLTTSVDMFALGLMTHYYLTGAIPGYEDRFGSPAEAVNADAVLGVDERLTSAMQKCLRAMTARDPGTRPRIAVFLGLLKDPDVCGLSRKGLPRTSRLRTNLGEGPTAARTGTPPLPPADANGRAAPRPASETTSTATPEPAPSPATPRTSRVRINFGDRPK